ISDFTPKTAAGRKVQSIMITNYLENSLRASIREAISIEREHRLKGIPCQDDNKDIPENFKLHFLRELGLKRFQRKCNRIHERLKEICHEYELRNSVKEPAINYTPNQQFYDKEFTPSDFKKEIIWQQLFYELTFEALGYSKNKDIMLRLAVEIDLDFVQKNISASNFIEEAEYLYFYVSGLIPKSIKCDEEEFKNYLSKMDSLWERVKNNFRGNILESSKWHFFQLRPQNFPTIRIAGGVRILYQLLHKNLLGRIFSAFEKIDHISDMNRVLKNLLMVKAEGFWKNHYQFDPKATTNLSNFIGYSRAEEIVLNVVLPFIKVFSDVFSKKKDESKVLTVYKTMLQQADNQVAVNVSKALSLPEIYKQSIFYQGLIELFRDYCSKKRCDECEIGKAIKDKSIINFA
ncbi:MAG: DUF2851 family protein, partial [Ignavibacteria bacterium]|nr:DUF2851 family protein [Ignavibacteria bacterium]